MFGLFREQFCIKDIVSLCICPCQKGVSLRASLEFVHQLFPYCVVCKHNRAIQIEHPENVAVDVAISIDTGRFYRIYQIDGRFSQHGCVERLPRHFSLSLFAIPFRCLDGRYEVLQLCRVRCAFILKAHYEELVDKRGELNEWRTSMMASRFSSSLFSTATSSFSSFTSSLLSPLPSQHKTLSSNDWKAALSSSYRGRVSMYDVCLSDENVHDGENLPIT